MPRVPPNLARRRVQETAAELVLLPLSVRDRTQRAAATVPHLQAGWGLDGRDSGLEGTRVREEGWESEWEKGNAEQPGAKERRSGQGAQRVEKAARANWGLDQAAPSF